MTATGIYNKCPFCGEKVVMVTVAPEASELEVSVFNNGTVSICDGKIIEIGETRFQDIRCLSEKCGGKWLDKAEFIKDVQAAKNIFFKKA